MNNRNWKNVSRKRPCAICEKPDWCSYSTDGEWASCRRISNPEYPPQIDRNGAEYYLYRRIPERYFQKRVSSPADALASKKLDPQPCPNLHEIYSDLLRELPLLKEHFHNLTQRGLNSVAIDIASYRSLTAEGCRKAAKALQDKYEKEALLKVPGLLLEGCKLRLVTTEGLLIPVRDKDARIVSLKVRSFRSTNRYSYFSSSPYGGPSATAAAHIPILAPEFGGLLRITEGELKADVVTHRTTILTISVPGVSQWKKCLPLLEHFRPEKLRLAFDKDAETNQHVARAVVQCANFCRALGYSIAVEDWK